MKPQHIAAERVRALLDQGKSAQDIANATGERVEMLVHLLSVHGEPGLSVRLAKAALGVRA